MVLSLLFPWKHLVVNPSEYCSSHPSHLLLTPSHMSHGLAIFLSYICDCIVASVFYHLICVLWRNPQYCNFSCFNPYMVFFVWFCLILGISPQCVLLWFHLPPFCCSCHWLFDGGFKMFDIFDPWCRMSHSESVYWLVLCAQGSGFRLSLVIDFVMLLYLELDTLPLHHQLSPALPLQLHTPHSTLFLLLSLYQQCLPLLPSTLILTPPTPQSPLRRCNR